MTRSIRLVVVIGIVSLASVVGFGLAGGASAQEDPTDANVTDVIESESEADTLANQEDIRLESTTTLVGWEFVDDQLRVAVEADRPTRVSMSDDTAGIGEAGATRVPVSTERVFDGTTVLVFPVRSSPAATPRPSARAASPSASRPTWTPPATTRSSTSAGRAACFRGWGSRSSRRSAARGTSCGARIAG